MLQLLVSLSSLVFLHLCLSVVSSGSDVFAIGDVVTSTHAANVLYCIASNFQEVKHLASTLLQQLPPSAVGLQVNITFLLIIIYVN